ncbi:AMIN domain-containing protein [Leptolyngbya sp. FACHB-17]|uniref:AMIN domain-containing protein n=1 Tax=unclassified Leptolyngbya TaxID=2650499 RepID=UPI0016814DA8|nr:AMIN domain-containing protein [Leptolyngbya sp. FACHB-17]MBD2078349.1 AMIN domain-containing protein [Leptolyngbya sp. FACHB-17]
MHRSISLVLMGVSASVGLARVATATEIKTAITGIQLQVVQTGLEVTFEVQGNPQMQRSSVSRENTLTMNFVNTQLRLPQGNAWRQENPTPEITSILVGQFEPNQVSIIINGTHASPVERVVRQDGKSITLSFSSKLQKKVESSSMQKPAALNSNNVLSRAPDRSASTPDRPTPSITSSVIQSSEVSSSPFSESSRLNASLSSIPQGRADSVADSAYSDVYLDDAQTQLMRTYQLNQVKATSDSVVTQTLTSLAETGGTVSGSSTGSSFGTGSSNFSGFDVRASAATAQTSIKRATATAENVRYQGAKEFLELLGANGGVNNKPANTFNAASASTFIPSSNQFSAQSSSSGFSQSALPPDFSKLPSSRSSSNLLNGLEVIAEPRTNTVTLIGSRRLVEIATLKLKQLDVLTKQVAVNIKIIDVDLIKGSNSNADLQYQASNTIGLGFNTAGSFFANFGRTSTGAGAAVPLARNFLLNLLASIQNQSAKILTNPTLVVQEGSSAQVNLTQEIFSGFETIEDTRFLGTTGTVTPLRRRPIIRPAGVIVNVTVDRIDPQGYVTLNISPEISAPSGAVFEDQGSQARLLLQRRLETGRIRLRNEQTLILTGIIQDQVRSNVTKVPILGDIPLLGRLFQRRATTTERREVVILVTPEILNDSDRSSFGVNYQPGSEVQKLLRQQDSR